MKNLLRHLAIGVFHLGGVGLFAVSALDSSFLVLPLGNDVLVITLCAARRSHTPYYVAMAVVGSVLGCSVTVWLSRKGEHKLRQYVSQKRLKYIESRASKPAGWMVAVASLMPPPFPFTPFVAEAAALKYPPYKLLLIIAGARLVRFGIEGFLAVRYGNWVLGVIKTRAFEYGVAVLIVLCIAASAYAIIRLIRQSRHRATSEAARPAA